jgi:hypothetical protein
MGWGGVCGPPRPPPPPRLDTVAESCETFREFSYPPG